MKQFTYPSVLTIAGFDGSGGAGIQADIKTISALGSYATTVLTALPVQNTMGVRSIYPIALEAVEDQLNCIFDDIRPDAIKIGMVHSTALVGTIAAILKKHSDIPVVFDPVMVATSGHKLIVEETVEAIVQNLLPLATIITPNMDEAAVLAGMPVRTLDEMYNAGEKIKLLSCKNILLKGGHLNTPMLTSLLFTNDGKITPASTIKINTKNMHGSGCTLSSAIATFLSQGYFLADAVSHAQQYVHEAILYGSDVLTGKGNGPLNHFFRPLPMVKNEMPQSKEL